MQCSFWLFFIACRRPGVGLFSWLCCARGGDEALTTRSCLCLQLAPCDKFRVVFELFESCNFFLKSRRRTYWYSSDRSASEAIDTPRSGNGEVEGSPFSGTLDFGDIDAGEVGFSKLQGLDTEGLEQMGFFRSEKRFS